MKIDLALGGLQMAFILEIHYISMLKMQMYETSKSDGLHICRFQNSFFRQFTA